MKPNRLRASRGLPLREFMDNLFDIVSFAPANINCTNSTIFMSKRVTGILRRKGAWAMIKHASIHPGSHSVDSASANRFEFINFRTFLSFRKAWTTYAEWTPRTGIEFILEILWKPFLSHWWIHTARNSFIHATPYQLRICSGCSGDTQLCTSTHKTRQDNGSDQKNTAKRGYSHHDKKRRIMLSLESTLLALFSSKS